VRFEQAIANSLEISVRSLDFARVWFCYHNITSNWPHLVEVVFDTEPDIELPV